MSIILDGKSFSAEMIEAGIADASSFESRFKRKPRLVVLFAGDNAASSVYVSNKEKTCKKVGIEFELFRFSSTATTSELISSIQTLNCDESIDGILVQLPLPTSIDEKLILSAISPEKDVDGFHPINIGRLWTGNYRIAPCTPMGIIRLLEHYSFMFSGAHSVIIGRSNIVGKPLAALLLERHCTVTIVHSQSRDLPGICQRADLLIAAIGKPAFINETHIRSGAWVVDVGINRIVRDSAPRKLLADDSPCAKSLMEKGHCLIGDVDPIAIRAVAGAYTPVPGGVGPMTIAMLITNTILLANHRASRSL